MATQSNFQIESYKVIVEQNHLENRQKITLTSPDLSHGIRMRATLVFGQSNFYKTWKGIGQITNVGGANFDGSDLTLFCDLSLFGGFYHVLNAEKPVYLNYWYDNLPNTDPKTSNTKLILSMSLTTDTELPGDADKDPLFINFPIGKVTI